MENQHRKIKGYRELSQRDIDIMNDIKEMGAKVGELVEKLTVKPGYVGDEDANQRWVAIAKTHLQQGFMALTRSVAKPTFF
jgi:predicted ribonuclease toxin of YeeF-YezG toxin-antitoxin module